MKNRLTKTDEIKLPPAHDWRTSDEDEINRRRLRARTEGLSVTNADARHPVFSNFRVRSPSGMTYSVEVRDVASRQFSCECPDFQANGLGTCKHVEAVLNYAQARHRKAFERALAEGSDRADIVPDDKTGGLRVERGFDRLPGALRRFFDGGGTMKGGSVEDVREALLQGLVAQAKIIATVNRLPEPADVEQALRAPIGPFWGERYGQLREFVADAAKPWNPVLDWLQTATASVSA
jgi:hypothetical protein